MKEPSNLNSQSADGAGPPDSSKDQFSNATGESAEDNNAANEGQEVAGGEEARKAAEEPVEDAQSANEADEPAPNGEQLEDGADEGVVDSVQPARTISKEKLALALITGGVFLVYFFSNPDPRSFYDYTFRIAEAMFHGRLGLTEHPGSWLNELIPFGGRYYSAFPLGSVLCMMPFALLKLAHVIDSMPGRLIAAILASGSSYFFFLLSAKYSDSLGRRTLLALFPVFGTWTWANLCFAGAWQLALGFALLGQAGALYFIQGKRRPLVAGLFFAIAFGNRTELLVVTPFLLYLLIGQENRPGDLLPPFFAARLWERRREIVEFLFVPLLLGILTLAYNYARFHSPFDFGYMRIPGIEREVWFKYGLFSIHAIPANAEAMLWDGWRMLNHSPYLVPTGFGGSIFLSSPLLFLLFRTRLRDRATAMICWIAIATLTLALWYHANAGGWQFSYRYAMVLLPWIFLVLLDNGGRKRDSSEGRKTSLAELTLFVLSVAINAYAMYEFLWTKNVQP